MRNKEFCLRGLISVTHVTIHKLVTLYRLQESVGYFFGGPINDQNMLAREWSHVLDFQFRGVSFSGSTSIATAWI